MRRFRIPELVAGFLLGLATLLVIFILSSDFAAHYEICEPTHAGAKDCTSYNMLSYALHKMGTAFEFYNGAITAVATAFIAWFTLSLRQSTDRLWKAGNDQLAQIKRSADISERALVGIERPWLFVNLHSHLGGEIGEYKIPYVVFDISNHGRMPAIIEECRISLGGGQLMPDCPLLRDEFHGAIGPSERMGNRVLDCPDGREYDLTVDLGNNTTHPSPRIAQDEEFFFYIELKYTDIESRLHTSRFCWRYDRGMDYWVKFDDADYNQIT